MDWVREFWKRARYALPSMLLLWGFTCMWVICWWWELAMVIVVGSLILIGLSIVASIAYAWGLAKEITKLVCCVDVSLRRCEMMYAPSGVGSRVGAMLRYSGVVMVSEER